MLNKFKIKTKLLATFILVSLIPLCIVSIIAINKSAQAIQKEVVAKFTAIQETKRNHIKDYFLQLQTAVSILKDDPYLQSTLTAFNNTFEENNNLKENDTWNLLVKFKESPIKAMVKKNGFYDLFMISVTGNIIYTVRKGDDLGLNIAQGNLAKSSLGAVFKTIERAEDDVVAFGDFSAYAPSKGEHAAFMMARMKNCFGKIIGYIAIRIPVDKFNKQFRFSNAD